MPNTVQAAGEAMPKTKADETLAVAKAFMGMEHDVWSLHQMATILTDMLDEEIVRDHAVDGCDGMFHVRMSSDRLNVLAFAWNDVAVRAKRVKDGFMAATRGEVLQ